MIKLCYQGHGQASWTALWELGLIEECFPWVRDLNDRHKKLYRDWVFLALGNSDQRFNNEETLSVSYLFAVLN